LRLHSTPGTPKLTRLSEFLDPKSKDCRSVQAARPKTPRQDTGADNPQGDAFEPGLGGPENRLPSEFVGHWACYPMHRTTEIEHMFD
jgi:hypothetical protein